MLLPLQRMGGSGPPLLVLHANGFLGACYRPLAAVLGAHFTVLALDMPGQGASAPLPPGYGELSTDHMVADLAASVAAHGLTGCAVLGHSLGATLALIVEAARPGTFCAMYLYEPVSRGPGGLALPSGGGDGGGDSSSSSGASTPPSPQRAGAPERHAALGPGEHPLSQGARRRRAEFNSPAEAAARLGAKPPFSQLHPDVLAAYVQYGLRPVQRPTDCAGGGGSSQPTGSGTGGAAGAARACYGCPPEPAQPPAAGASSPASAGAPSPGQVVWRLVTEPGVEAAVYDAFTPPPLITHPQCITCPLLLAVGGLEQPPHDLLPGLGRRLCAQLPRGRLHTWEGLGHFGPLERPAAVAAAAGAWLRAAMFGQAQRGDEPARARL